MCDGALRYQPNQNINLFFLINIGTKDLTHLNTVWFYDTTTYINLRLSGSGHQLPLVHLWLRSVHCYPQNHWLLVGDYVTLTSLHLCVIEVKPGCSMPYEMEFHGHAYKENIDKCDTYSVMGQMMNIYLQR